MRIDGVDLGCGTGGSIGWSKNRFGGDNHIGYDNEESDISEAIKSGYNVEYADITSDDFVIPQCRFITSLHTFEHLQDEETILKLLKKCVASASEFIFIKVPFFDNMDYLKSLGLRLTWTNWVGHPTAVTFDMLKRLLEELELSGTAGFLHPVIDSSLNEIIPVDSPIDTIYYNESLGNKDIIPLINVYRETYCFINVNCTPERWDELMQIDIT